MAKWKLVSKHDYEFLGAIPQYLIALITLLIGLPMTAGGVALLIYGTGGQYAISAYIFGILLSVIGLLLSVTAILIFPRRQVKWVRVYEEGLKWKVGGREYKYRWNEATDVDRTEMQTVDIDGRPTPLGRTSYVVLHLADNNRVSFTPSLTNYDRLANYVQKAVTESQLAGAATELSEEGKTFGLVQINRKGVTYIGKFFPWKELRWLDVQNGELCAHHSCTRWRPIPLSEIPNSMLLLSLVRGLGRLRE